MTDIDSMIVSRQPHTGELHLMVGFPGSGKSHYAKDLARRLNADIVSTDGIREELYGDESIQGDWQEIDKVLNDRLAKGLSEGKHMIVDATNLSPRNRSFIQRYTQYPTHAHVMDTTWEQSAKNNLIRQHNGGRLVNKDYMTRLRTNPYNTPPTEEEGFASIEHIPWQSPGKDYDELGDRLFREAGYDL